MADLMTQVQSVQQSAMRIRDTVKNRSDSTTDLEGVQRAA
ncbi:Uncharacterized protein ABJ98_2319 [Pseudomonas syringae pv. aceris]|nr:Uncharacterized protein ABJ98_2319 [Pseudomonas syringae pv. aceris]